MGRRPVGMVATVVDNALMNTEPTPDEAPPISDQSHSEPTKKTLRQSGSAVAVGIAIGAAVGASVGVVADNIGVGLGVGIAIGAAVGAAIGQRD